jgi:YD repeat-containing protein
MCRVAPTEVDYTYDGPLATSATWSKGIPASPVVHAAYDGLGRVIERDANLSTSVAWGYDADGRLASAGVETFSRDPSCGAGGVSGLTALLAGVQLDSDTDSYCYSLYGEVNQYSATVGTAGAFAYAVTFPMRDALGRITEKVESVTINGVLNMVGGL